MRAIITCNFSKLVTLSSAYQIIIYTAHILHSKYRSFVHSFLNSTIKLKTPIPHCRKARSSLYGQKKSFFFVCFSTVHCLSQSNCNELFSFSSFVFLLCAVLCHRPSLLFAIQRHIKTTHTWYYFLFCRLRYVRAQSPILKNRIHIR